MPAASSALVTSPVPAPSSITWPSRPWISDSVVWASASASRRPLGTTAPMARGRRNQRFRNRAVPACSAVGMAYCAGCIAAGGNHRRGRRFENRPGVAHLLQRVDHRHQDRGRIGQRLHQHEDRPQPGLGIDRGRVPVHSTTAASHSRTVSTASPRAMPSAMPSVARSSILGVRMKGSRLVARP